MFTRETVKHLCQMMARYKVLVYVSFLFFSSVVKFDKKMCEFNTKITIAQILRLTIV